MDTGHLFVALGKIGTLASDIAIIPTDRSFNVESYWVEVFDPGRSGVECHQPARWAERGWGRSAERDDVWFLDVFDATPEAPDSFDRLGALLADIARRQLASSIKGRPVPLVLVPVIGTKGGGKSAFRGEVIERLLGVCSKFVGEHLVDIAIVTPNRSAFSAIQSRRAEHAQDFFPSVNLLDARRLGKLASEKSLALFIGAGTSIPAGLPSWEELLRVLASQAKLTPSVRDSFETLSALDQAELVHSKLGDRLPDAVVQALSASEQPRPALAHALLAGLEVQCAVTTNYDDFYELAGASSGEASDAERTITAVLPTQVPTGSQRWLLKMHGSLDQPSTIVLTRGQFATFQGSSGPSGGILQSLLLTKHVMVVGTSMTDDNVLRLIYEVIAYCRDHRVLNSGAKSRELFGSVIEVGNNPARQELYSEHFICVPMRGSSLQERARHLEIFLDAVGAYAATDASWLLDPAYAYLHTERGQIWATKLRQLATEIEAEGDTSGDWGGVLTMLRGFGMKTPSRPARLEPRG